MKTKKVGNLWSIDTRIVLVSFFFFCYLYIEIYECVCVYTRVHQHRVAVRETNNAVSGQIQARKSVS